jgi:hypothetical protein
MRNFFIIQFSAMSKDFLQLTVDQSELDKMNRWLDDCKEESTKRFKDILTATVKRIVRRSMQLAPVDKGLLRSAIHPIYPFSDLVAGVFVQRDYSAYQEWGTGDLVDKAATAADKADFGVDSMDWKGKGIRKVNIKPHPYLFESARISINEMMVKLRDLMK